MVSEASIIGGIHKAMFDKDISSLGIEPDLGKVSSPGLNRAVQSLLIGIFIWTSTQVSACQRGSNSDWTGEKQSEKNLQQNGFAEVNGNIPLAKYENKEKP